jgi:hypothetical protein
MENKRKLAYWSAGAIGLFFPVFQVAIYYLRFGRLNPYAPLTDYALFFLAGTAGGLILIALLRRSRTKAAKWNVVIAFLLATPFAIFGMLGGGLLGPVGIVLFPALIWGIVTGIGYWIGKFISKRESQRTEA